MLRDATLPELNAEFGSPRAAAESHLTIACLADIQPEPLRWLWPGRFPLGKLSILSGDPGLGKSLVTLAIAAAVSRGSPWPCREGTATLGDVVLISAEDDAADTIRPRLEAAGADLKRIHVLEGVDQSTDSGDTVHRPWNFGDVKALDRLLAAKPDCRLVVVDPISAYLAGTDSHKNADVRGLLAPLADMAAHHGVAVLAVSHLNKSAGPAMYRTTGSLAFVAAARAAFAVAKDKDDLGRRLVLPIKCNLSPDSSGLAYRIGQSSNGAPVVEWETRPVTITADEALAVMNDDVEDRSQTDEAVDWLRALLGDGPQKAGEVQREARQAGISDKALRRARERLKIRPSKSGFSGAWTWALPEDAQPAQGAHTPDVGIFETEGILGARNGCTAEEYRHIKEGE